MNRRSYTLGKAIKEAQANKLYDEELQISLEMFLKQRNWLVHKSVDSFYETTGRLALYTKIQAIAWEAHMLQRQIEDDLIVFSERNGLDMSSVKAVTETFYKA